MYKYSMSDVRRVAARATLEVKTEEAAAKAAIERIVNQGDVDPTWGQHSMTEMLAFQECEYICNHTYGWIQHVMY